MTREEQEVLAEIKAYCEANDLVMTEEQEAAALDDVISGGMTVALASDRNSARSNTRN